jgi:hypothetical protein
MVVVTEKGPKIIEIGIGAWRSCPHVPCHTTRHAGPHRAV